MKTILFSCLLQLTFLHHPLQSSAQAQGPFTSTNQLITDDSFSPSSVMELNVRVGANRLILDWTVEDNQAINQFILEKSDDGKNYQTAALIFGSEKKDVEQYSFVEKLVKKAAYYRVVVLYKNGEKEIMDPVMVSQKRSTFHQ